MPITQLESLLVTLAMILIPAGFGGAGFMLLREAGLAGGPDAGEPGQAPAMLMGVVDSVRRVGDRIAIQDPSQISALRAKLMRAGFFNREAVTLYLGVRMVALGLATAATLLLLPFVVAAGKGVGATAMAAVFAIVALLGPEQVLKARSSSVNSFRGSDRGG